MRFNRFVSLNRPMLSLEAHLGVTASPQAPFPTDFVTLPVSSKSPPLRLTFSRSRERACPGTATSNLPGPAFQTCSSNFTPMWAGYVGWAYCTPGVTIDVASEFFNMKNSEVQIEGQTDVFC